MLCAVHRQLKWWLVFVLGPTITDHYPRVMTTLCGDSTNVVDLWRVVKGAQKQVLVMWGGG